MKELKQGARFVTDIQYHGPYTVASSIPASYSVTLNNVSLSGSMATPRNKDSNSGKKVQVQSKKR